MTLNVNDAGTWKAAVPHVNDAGTWKPVAEAWVNDAGTWKQAFAAAILSAVSSPGSEGVTGSTATLTTPSETVSVFNGTGPYTYAWTVNLDGSGTITAVSATSASTAFRATLMVSGETRTAIAYCTVTDTANGQTAITSNVPITITRT